MRLLIIRHAEPDYKNNTITPAGHQEARALAQHLRVLGWTRYTARPWAARRTPCATPRN
jgi:probable phosphoglycerate mutase